MPKEGEFSASEEEYSDFVPAVYAKSLEEARLYRELLNDHDIPAIISDEQDQAASKGDKNGPGKTGSRSISRGVAVLVPDSLLDEASEIIADREDSDEFGIVEDLLEDDEEEDQKEEGFDPEQEDLEAKPEEPDEDDEFFLDDDQDEEKDF